MSMYFSGGQQVFVETREVDVLEGGTYVCTETAAVIPNLPEGIIELCIQADIGNKTAVLIGPLGSQPISLAAGSMFGFGELNSPEAVYIKKAGSKVAKINWIARRAEIV